MLELASPKGWELVCLKAWVLYAHETRNVSGEESGFEGLEGAWRSLDLEIERSQRELELLTLFDAGGEETTLELGEML